MSSAPRPSAFCFAHTAIRDLPLSIICVGGWEKGRDNREVMRLRRSRRFLREVVSSRQRSRNRLRDPGFEAERDGEEDADEDVDVDVDMLDCDERRSYADLGGKLSGIGRSRPFGGNVNSVRLSPFNNNRLNLDFFPGGIATFLEGSSVSNVVTVRFNGAARSWTNGLPIAFSSPPSPFPLPRETQPSLFTWV